MKRTLLPGILLLMTAVGFTQAKKVLPGSAQVKNTVISFYKWYNQNWKKIDAFKLYKSKKGNDGPPYVIDWKAVEGYFSYLRKNVPYAGEDFIANERKHFKKAEKDFKSNPEEEIPMGFDYDRFTNSQEEPKWFVGELLKKDKHWTITMQGSATASVSITQKTDEGSSHTFFCIDLVKEKGRWVLAKLGCETGEEAEAVKEKEL